ncbi:MAG TPA: hypothetical protein DEP46_00985 [Blastocatellia bacterium]|nr:hypothetical protein [Blastocatellia bacterium]
MTEALILIVSTIVGFILVEIVRRWGLRRQVLDIPNERSSHTSPVPRAGGIGIVATVIGGYLVGSFIGGYPISFGFLIGGVLIAAVSFIDDLRDLPFYVRLFAHSIAAALLIADSGAITEISYSVSGSSVSLGLLAVPLTFGAILWMINAYNFMDGIDGIAGLQALVAAAGWVIFAAIFGDNEVKWLALSIGGSAIGFLVLNWSPARIFMGDVGSAFLGFAFAALPLLAFNTPNVPRGLVPLFALLVVFPFVFDTVFTFARRLTNREKVWKAHRSHLYQRMVINGASHASVTLLYGALAATTTLAGVGLMSASETALAFALLSVLTVSTILLLKASKKR